MDQPLSHKKMVRYRRKLSLRLFIGIFVTIGLLAAIHQLLSPSVDRDSLRTDVVESEPMSVTIDAGGVVVPANQQTMTSETNARILEVFAQQGQLVKAGAPLLQLDNRSLELAIDNILEKIALKDTQIKARELNRKQSSNQVNSRYQLLEVELERLSVKASRLQQLSLTGAASQQGLLEAQLDVKRVKIEMQQLKQSLHDIQSTSDADIEGLQLEKSILSKSLHEKQEILNRSLVVARRNGILTWINSQQGSSVRSGDPLAIIADHQNFRVEATLSDFYAPQLEPGMKAVISYNSQNLDGQLEMLTPTIENGVMKLIVKLNNPSAKFLHQNIKVDVGLVTKQIDRTNTISKGPFVKSKGLQKVFVIRNGTAFRTEIEIGLGNNDKYQIIRGVKPGDEIIISDVSQYLHLKQFSISERT